MRRPAQCESSTTAINEFFIVGVNRDIDIFNKQRGSKSPSVFEEIITGAKRKAGLITIIARFEGLSDHGTNITQCVFNLPSLIIVVAAPSDRSVQIEGISGVVRPINCCCQAICIQFV